jgi:hypothetical protein
MKRPYEHATFEYAPFRTQMKNQATGAESPAERPTLPT